MMQAPQGVELVPLIMAGGSGTRYPKQLLRLSGSRTLLQETASRLEGLCGEVEGQALRMSQPMVVCGEEMRFLALAQLEEVGCTPGTVLLEPCARNTAPALTAACVHLRDAGCDPLILVMPADHVVRDAAAFRERVASAATLAASGRIVTFGIRADRPETGYGYIRVGRPIEGGAGNEVGAFVEKPDRSTAERYLATGDYLWNAGIFLVRASSWLDAVARHQPEMLAACKEAVGGGSVDGAFLRLAGDAFSRCPVDSIDYAVLEPSAADSAALAVVPTDIGWSDVGSWSALLEIGDADADGNVTQGDVLSVETAGSLLLAGDRLLASVGVENLVVVCTTDAVLVAHRDRAQDVRKIVDQLEQQGREEARLHRRVHRPWGSYEQMDVGERFQVKRLTVKPGAELSLQMHHHRAEHWVVVRGTAQVTRGDETFLVSENESTYIPLGTVHRLANPGMVDLEVIEVQSGSYLGEDDIVRLRDRYDRTPDRG
jgi:mannose-1-phosphate guanylyltransferase/mannose-6-phosphate isomerase